ncbi:MAG: helix-turn-helix transcriptional regulator [Bacillus sp. (in: firmicutes)]
MEKGTKHRILYLYSYLIKHTDTDHPLSTNQLIKALRDEFDMHVGRNTIGDDLAVMKECNMHVDFYDSTQNLYYFDGQAYEIAELKLLIDAITSSKFITQRKSDELIAKLLTLTNDHTAAMLRRHTCVSGRVKSDNEKGYYIVDTINTAIDTKRKIQFYYTDFDVNKERYITNDGKPYTLSPYTLTWDGDYYYVRGFCDERQEMRNFRIDRIDKTPEILNEIAIMAPENYNPARYSKEVFRMFDTDEPDEVLLHCDVCAMKAILDNFGLDVDTTPIDNQSFEAKVMVCTSPTFYRWVFGFGGKIKIVGPKNVLEKYKQLLMEALAELNDDNL